MPVFDLACGSDLKVVAGNDVPLVGERAADLQKDILVGGNGALVGQCTLYPDVNRTGITLDRGIDGKRCADGLQNNSEIALDHAFVAEVAGQDLHVSGAGDATAILEIVDIELHLAVTGKRASLGQGSADFALEQAAGRYRAPGVIDVRLDIEPDRAAHSGARSTTGAQS